MRKAIIKYTNNIAGILTEQNDGGFVFEYDKSYIRNFPDKFICFSMPVSKFPFYNQQLFPFFDGLLPEGWLLDIACKSHGIAKSDRMGLLLACCNNCIGAVSVHPLEINEKQINATNS